MGQKSADKDKDRKKESQKIIPQKHCALPQTYDRSDL